MQWSVILHDFKCLTSKELNIAQGWHDICYVFHRSIMSSAPTELEILITTGGEFRMKGRDVALFVSIQGILLGAAFMLSSGEANLQKHTSQVEKPVQTQSWTNASVAAPQPVARPMNMQNFDQLQQVGQAGSVAETLERARQQRRWVF